MSKILNGFLIGITCVVIGIFILRSYFKDQKTQTVETTATVIRVDSELETDSDGLDTRYFYPVVTYTVNGIKYETRLPDSGTTDSTAYKEGQTVSIKYNPDNPKEISKKDSKSGIFGGVFFIVLGIFAIIGSFKGNF